MSRNSSKILGVIPARFQSSRFPGKLLKEIMGKTLIQRTYENASRAKTLDELIIATDDERILEHVKGFGGKVVMTSKDCLTGTDRIAQAIRHDFVDYPIIVNIQGDEPCLNPSVIDQLSMKLIETENHEDCVMTTPVVKLKKIEDILNPSVVKCVFDFSGKALYFSRAPIPYPKAMAHFSEFIDDYNQVSGFLKEHQYYRHLGVYCFRREFLLSYSQIPPSPLQMSEDLEQLKILEHGHCIRVVVVDDEGIGVDRPEDIKKIEEILCRQNTYSSQVV